MQAIQCDLRIISAFDNGRGIDRIFWISGRPNQYHLPALKVTRRVKNSTPNLPSEKRIPGHLLKPITTPEFCRASIVPSINLANLWSSARPTHESNYICRIGRTGHRPTNPVTSNYEQSFCCQRAGAAFTNLVQTYSCLQARNCRVNTSSSARYLSPCSFV